MIKAFSLEIKKGRCPCKEWDFFTAHDKNTEPDHMKKTYKIHDCNDLTVYQRGMQYFYVRKNGK